MDTNPQTPSTAPTTPPTQTSSETNGLAVAALITGLLGMGIIPIILGALGLKKPGGRGMSIAGIVLGVLQIIIGTIVLIALLAGAISLGKDVKNNPDKYRSTSSSTTTDAKKDFAKDEVAQFGKFKIKVNSVTRNYVPANEFERADSGKELIVLNLSATNTSADSEYLSDYDLKVDVNGSEETPSFTKGPGTAFNGGSLAAGAVKTGELVYEIPAGAQNLKLVNEESEYSLSAGKIIKTRYTLGL